jgi:mono/diheme cytochrome c family protein
MKGRAAEIVAVMATLAGIAAATALPLYYDSRRSQNHVPAGAQVISLTGLSDYGMWTEETVNGSNYWQQGFRPARPVLQVGRRTVIRLESADVIHNFYIPALGVGPVEVHPGHVEEIVVTPRSPGVFGYYCTTMCGAPHFGMKGVVIVQDEGVPTPPEPPSAEAYWSLTPPPPGAARTERGRWLYHQKGCMTCHGTGGSGGVPNYNYISETVPRLDTLASKMFLFHSEDVATIVEALESGILLESLENDPPVPRFGAVLAQYQSIRDVVRKGRSPRKLDPDGPPQPLEMPAWEYQLSDADIDAILAYLLTLETEGDQRG